MFWKKKCKYTIIQTFARKHRTNMELELKEVPGYARKCFVTQTKHEMGMLVEVVFELFKVKDAVQEFVSPEKISSICYFLMGFLISSDVIILRV